MWSGVLGLTVTRSAHNSGKPLIADPIDVPGTAYGGRSVPGDCQGDAISKRSGSKRGASAGGVLLPCGLESAPGEESNAAQRGASASTRAASSCGTSASTSSHESAWSSTRPLE